MLQDRHVGVVHSWNALSFGGGAFFHILIQKNRTAIKSLIRCTHFLARNHIAYTTDFDKSVDLVVACVGESLETFLEIAGKKAQYTSKVAAVGFLDAIGTWVEKNTVKATPSSTILFYHG